MKTSNDPLLVRHIQACLEQFAHPSLQESYDNCGLQVGNPEQAVSGILYSLDVTLGVLNEAMERGCNLVVAHHPLIFGGLKRVAGGNEAERCVAFAIRNSISVLAVHTNIDHVMGGVSWAMAERLGLQNCSVLQPIEGRLRKLVTYVPKAHLEPVRKALFSAGAGSIGAYSECSFSMEGEGTFTPAAGSNPAVGSIGQAHVEHEHRLEVLLNDHQSPAVLQALFQSHPYEEVAYELIALHNANKRIGAGVMGEFSHPLEPAEALKRIAEAFDVEVVRHTQLPSKPLSKVALCGGSGSFLIKTALRQKADLFLTADLKYHQFFEAEGNMVLADIGHFESERHTPALMMSLVKQKFPTFGPCFLASTKTNPIHYFIR